MPNFHYLAITVAGKERKGDIQATDSRSAITSLRDQGLFVTTIEEKAQLKSYNQDFDINQYRSVPNTQLVFFFKQLSFMLRSGLPVLQTLQLSLNQLARGRLNLAIQHMIIDVENGHSLSMAMEKHPDVFPPLAINLMIAGESTGNLDGVAHRLAAHLEKKAALKSQTANVMIYPSVVVVAAIAVVIFLMVKIIPAFTKFLSQKGKALPHSTQLLIDLSGFMMSYGLYIFAGLIIFMLSIMAYYSTANGRYVIDSFVLKIPLLGKLITHSVMAELSWSMSMMLRSGLTAYDSLKICAKVIGNRLISTKLTAAAELILSGKDLASSLQHPAIPELMTQMTAVGEQSATLDEVLQEVGSFYEEQLTAGVKRMSAMLEPTLILVVGGIVSFVYFAFFQAMLALVAKG
jgi:type IV pilus assembly protein PilC